MVSENWRKDSLFLNPLKKLLNAKILDIIIFGSLVKNGTNRDIDIAVLIKSKVDHSLIRKNIKFYLGEKADIQILTIDSIYSSLWLTLIKEGYSLAQEKYLSEIYRVEPKVLYKYSLTKLSKVQKVQFERGIKHVLGSEGQFLSRAVVLIPLTLKSRMIEFLKHWNIYYESQEYELLPILRKEEM